MIALLMSPDDVIIKEYEIDNRPPSIRMARSRHNPAKWVSGAGHPCLGLEYDVVEFMYHARDSFVESLRYNQMVAVYRQVP